MALAGETSTARTCPACGNALAWLEWGAVSGRKYDDYRRCVSGCDLCGYERRARP